MEKIKNNFYAQVQGQLAQCSQVAAFDSGISQGKTSLVIEQVNQSIKAVLAARAFTSTGKNIFFITKDDKSAEDYAEDLAVLTQETSVFFIPDFETLPYEERSPHYMLRAQRMQAIANLHTSQRAFYTLSFRNLVKCIVNPHHIWQNITQLSIAKEYSLDALQKAWLNCGYENTTQIEKAGQFSKRGGIVDIFSPNYNQPIRLEFFGDEIVSIRHFSVHSQRSELKELNNVFIVPCREVILNEETRHSLLAGKIAIKGYYEGIEADIPLLYSGKYSLFDYIDPEASVLFFNDFGFDFNILKEYIDEIEALYFKTRLNNNERQLAEPSTMCLSQSEVEAYFTKYSVHFLGTGAVYLPPSYNSEAYTIIKLSTEPSPVFNSDMQILEQYIQEYHAQGYRIFIQLENEAQRHRMEQMLGDLASSTTLTIGVLHRGFIFHNARLVVFTDHEIFRRIKHRKLDLAFSKGEALIDYDSIKPGDYIVHIDHGIGIYEGIVKLDIGGKNIECLTIQYAGTDKLYVPTWQLSLVAKYVSEEGVAPTIHKLAGKAWDQTKQKAKSNIELVIEDIVQLYAERKIRKGINFGDDSQWQAEMEQSFIYEDTPDQKTATEEIKADMESDTPMERLLCGDVGFGKTEVAIRVAFKAVLKGFQVAVLVPTTLLAEQHYNVFRERLAQFPVQIAMLSRFRSSAQIKKDIDRLKRGEIDIVIGTHRLLSADVVFKRIGLLIVDEEHRFGVNHKDKIRKLKANIDTLYMSATPIPRTMNMILSRLKSMSLIQTSPKARLPIRTVVVPHDPEIIKDAIQRELDRGGQVFYVHNRIETIDLVYRELKELMPNLRLAVGHGQMPEKELERVMIDFANHEYDVLLSTTIIESGIDIPNVNTVIVNRADMFGLAQLYQIRGRVGRSNRRAYAYLMIPNKLSDVARKRLETLTEYESLGAGYQIAMRDLEIRGAGTLLGNKQSGVITSVGFNFYNRLLDQAVNNLLAENPKGLWDEEEDREELRQIELGTDFYFPADYITDERQKLQIYKRMIEFKQAEDFTELATELKDRYGHLPPLAQNVIDYFKMRMITRKIGLKTFMVTQEKMIIEYDAASMPSRQLLSNLITTSEYPIRFDTTSGLKVVFDFPKDVAKDNAKKLAFAYKIIERLLHGAGKTDNSPFL